jgi:hypothetical protein
MKKKRVMVGMGLVASLGTGWVLLRGQAPEKESDPVKLTPHMYQVPTGERVCAGVGVPQRAR